MTARRFYLVNESTLVKGSEARAIAAACNRQIRDHIAPAWQVERVIVSFHDGTADELRAAEPGSWVMRLVDTTDQAGALGWHSVEAGGVIVSDVAVKPSLDAGSGVLTGPYAVSATASHEFAETLCDRYCGGWEDSGRGFLIAREVSDPVEAAGYDLGGVRVSDFVLPAYFDATTGEPGPFDHLGQLHQPFAMLPGGYWVQMRAAAQQQEFKRTAAWLEDSGFDVRGGADGPQLVFSPEMPEWRRELKAARGRNAIRRGVSAGTG